MTDAFYSYLEIVGVLVGLIYLWLEYKASIHLWIAGMIMPAIYIFIYIKAGLYADVAFNIYYLLAAVYGLAVWLRGRNKTDVRVTETADDTTGVRSIAGKPSKLLVGIIAATVALFFAIAFALKYFTDSEVPWFNALNASLSIVGMWMLAKKYAEQWLVWIAADIACTALYIYTGLYPTAMLYALYTVIAVFGYYRWKGIAKANYRKANGGSIAQPNRK